MNRLTCFALAALCVVFLSSSPAASGLAAQLPQVVQPDDGAYNADELRVLHGALDTLRVALSESAYASQKTFGLAGWGTWTSADLADYTAGVLAGRGYEVRLVSAAGWSDGVHTWILVGLSVGDRVAWIPVEASPNIGETQHVLGAIPEEASADGSTRFDTAYLTFDRLEERPGNSAPAAKIRCPETVQVADWFSLAATGSSDEDGSIVLYLWDFGDGTPASAVVARSARHRYVRAGTYTVTLTVVDNRGATATAEATVHSTSSCGCG